MTRNEYRWVAEIHFGIYSNAPEWLTMIQYVFSFLIIFALYNIIYFVTVYIYIYGTTIYIYIDIHIIYIYICPASWHRAVLEAYIRRHHFCSGVVGL